MQHPQPEDVHSEFPPPPPSFHPHAHNFQQWEMGTDYQVNPRFSQPTDQSINASVTRNTYSIPNVMDQTFLANSASTLPQRCPPYLGSTPSGTLTDIPHLPYLPTVGFAHGNNYIGVVNIESPTRPKQSKKRKRGGGTSPSRKCKRKYKIHCTRKYTDKFCVHLSSIVGFTKSQLLRYSGWANSASQQHAMRCWTFYI